MRAGRGCVVKRPHMPDQGTGIDACSQVERIEEFLRFTCEIVAINETGGRPLDRCHPNLKPQTINNCDAFRPTTVIRSKSP